MITVQCYFTTIYNFQFHS